MPNHTQKHRESIKKQLLTFFISYLAQYMKTVAIQHIKSNPKNPRIIKDDKFKKLVQSIKDFPDMLEKRPLVIDENNIVL